MAKIESLKNKFLLTTTFTASLLGYYRRSYAAACIENGGTYLCSGSGNTAAENINTNNANVSTEDEFAIDVSSNNAAIKISGNGALSFTDNYNSTISSVRSALDISSYGDDGGTAGSINLNINSTINSLNSGSYGVRTYNQGNGDVNIEINGIINANERGLGAFNASPSSNTSITFGSNSRINLAYASSTSSLIYGNTQGTVDINFNGYGYSNYGINFTSSGSSNSITVGSNGEIKSSRNGMFLFHGGSNAIEITVEGDITATSHEGIYLSSTNGSIITLENGGNISGNTGITSKNATTLILNGTSEAVSLNGTGGVAANLNNSENNSVTITSNVSITGDITAGSGEDTLTFNSTNATLTNTTFTGFESTTISGTTAITGDLTITGTSETDDTLTLSGANLTLNGTTNAITAFENVILTGTNTITGGLNLETAVISTASDLKVNSGTLTVDSLTLNSGATLSGTGTVTGDVTLNSGATLAAGNSIGTSYVVGDLTFNSGSTLEIEIEGNSADKTVVTGAIEIDSGAILNIIPLNGTASGSATILTSTAGINGTFGTVTTNGTNVSLVYTDDLNISFVTADVSTLGSQIQSSVNSSFLFNDTLTQQIADNAFNKDRNFWVKGIYRNRNTSEDNSSANGFNSRATGMAFGAQKEVNDHYKVGFAISQINDNLGLKGNQGSRNSESTFASIYGIYNQDLTNNAKLFTSLSLGFGYHDGKNKRLVTNAGIGAYANSITNDSDLSLTAQTGIKFQPEKCYYIMPLVSASYIKTFAGGFQETDGGNSNLKINDYDFSTIKFRESVRIGSNTKQRLSQLSIPQLSNITYTPYVELGLAQEKAISDRSISGEFFNGNRFTTNLDKKDRNFLTMAIGAKAEITKDVSSFVSYERSTSNQENRNDLRVGVGIKF
jgi:hypothetical protein